MRQVKGLEEQRFKGVEEQRSAQLEAAEAILWDWLCRHAATGRR